MFRKLLLCATVSVVTGSAAAQAADVRVVRSAAPYPRYAYFMPPCYESPHALVLHCAPDRYAESSAYIRYDSVPFIPRRATPAYTSIFRW